MDMQCSRAAQHTEGRDESDESEAVVAMQMRDEDVVESREAEACAAILHLSTLTTINHVELVAQVDDLRGGIVACGGQSRSAT